MLAPSASRSSTRGRSLRKPPNRSPELNARKTLKSPSSYSTCSSSSAKSSAKPRTTERSRSRKPSFKSRSVKRPRVQFAPQEDAETLTSLGTKSGYLKKKFRDADQEEAPENEWEWYYCVLRPATFLYYYRSEEDSQPCGIVDLEYLRSLKMKAEVDRKERADFTGGSKHSFRLAMNLDDEKISEDVFESLQTQEGDEMELYLDPPDAAEGEEWIDAVLSRQSNSNPQEDTEELLAKLNEADSELEKLRQQLEDAENERQEAVESYQQELVESSDLVGEFQQGAEMLADEAEAVFERCREMLENATGREYDRLSMTVREEKGANEGAVAAIRILENIFVEAMQELEQHEEMLVSLREQENDLLNRINEKNGISEEVKEKQKALEAEIGEKDDEIDRMHNDLECIQAHLRQCQSALAEKECIIDELRKASRKVPMRKDAEDDSLSTCKSNRSEAKNRQQSAHKKFASTDSDRPYPRSKLAANKNKANVKGSDISSSKAQKSSRIAGAMNTVRKRVLSKNNAKLRSQDEQGSQGTRSSDGSAHDCSDNDGDTTDDWSRLESRRYPGEYYYHNVRTGENSWTNPADRADDSPERRNKPSQRTSKRAHKLPSPLNKNRGSRDRPVKSVINLEASPFVVRGENTRTQDKPTNSDPTDLDDHFDSSDYDSEAYDHEQPNPKSATKKGKFTSFRWKKAILPKKSTLVKSLTSSKKLSSWKKKKQDTEPADFDMDYGKNRHEF